MRNAFADEILQLAKADPKIVVLSGDIGNRLFDKFKVAAPERFYNVGVAEANMISMAAGLASSGLRPVCYTITPFVTTRCLEQIKVDVCYHHVPVVIVGTGSGLSYAGLGATHHSFEDLAIMRVLPGMDVLAPSDSNELRSCLRSAMATPHPCYIRIGKKGEPLVYPEVPPFALGKWQQVREGQRIALLAAGNMLPSALETADLLTGKGFRPAVIGCASIKPLDTGLLAKLTSEFEMIATLEEHSVIGGFGSAVGDWILEHASEFRGRVLRFGIADEFMHEAGEQEHARHLFGLDAPSMASKIEQSMPQANR